LREQKYGVEDGVVVDMVRLFGGNSPGRVGKG
jgi:hypothetical protein